MLEDALNEDTVWIISAWNNMVSVAGCYKVSF
jgi:hypothetical protein